MMNTENGFVVLEWPYGIRLTTTDPSRKLSRSVLERVRFACAVVDVRNGTVPPGLAASYPTPDAARDAFLRVAPTLVSETPVPEVDRVMTLSTAHVTPETARKLARNGDDNEISLAVYDKATFGWFVYLGGVQERDVLSLPDDLRACVNLAVAHGCSILCLDCDAVALKTLPTYDWDDESEART